MDSIVNNIFYFLFGTFEQFDNNNHIKYTFIHVTKCGGVAVERLFETHYSNYYIISIKLVPVISIYLNGEWYYLFIFENPDSIS